jgi:hypothetical protein
MPAPAAAVKQTGGAAEGPRTGPEASREPAPPASQTTSPMPAPAVVVELWAGGRRQAVPTAAAVKQTGGAAEAPAVVVELWAGRAGGVEQRAAIASQK